MSWIFCACWWKRSFSFWGFQQGTLVTNPLQAICFGNKLLGLTFDDELSFDVHVEKLCTKLSQRIAVLSKMKRCLPHRERIIYFNAMIKPVILYGSSKEILNRVLKLRKRAAWVILDMDTSARSVDMFKQLDWIPYYDEVKIFKATVAYKRINSESPGYLTN